VFFTDNGVRTPTPEVIAAVRSAAAVLADAGAHLEERVPPQIAELADAWWDIARADGHAWLLRLINGAGTPGHGSYAWLDDERPVPAAELTDMLERVDDARAGLTRFMRDVDLIVSPAGPLPAFRHGEGSSETYADSYCEAHNLTGWPSVVVRAGTSPEGLPLGVQLVAKPWREDVALAAARTVESALGGWRRPSL
jgi:amidase